jgi:hypothetical protein
MLIGLMNFSIKEYVIFLDLNTQLCHLELHEMVLLKSFQ